MLTRIKNKISREKIKQSRTQVPFQKETTYVQEGVQWYDPLLAGPSTFVDDCSSAQTVKDVLKIMKALTPDEYLDFTIRFYEAGLKGFGTQWRYADIITVLYGICKNVRIESYMEIGVRRGRSMATVASLCPDSMFFGFDKWIADYVGLENPGPQFVAQEIKKVGFNGKLQFISGDSQFTVPRFFKDQKDVFFDLIVVDGDHSKTGAARDLKNVIPRLKVGGFLVFDDIANPWHPGLDRVWQKEVRDTGRFSVWSFDELGYGVAMAVKRW